jgi:hypothetical protein
VTADDGNADANATAGMLLLVTADLFLGSRLRAAAEQAGYRVVTAAASSRLAAAVDVDRPLRLAIDLTTPGIDLAECRAVVGDADFSRSLAYAPHVRVDLLKAARGAGIGTVITRSQLDASFLVWLTAD